MRLYDTFAEFISMNIDLFDNQSLNVGETVHSIKLKFLTSSWYVVG